MAISYPHLYWKTFNFVSKKILESFSLRNYHHLYNKLSYARILIGSHSWSIGGQTCRWRALLLRTLNIEQSLLWRTLLLPHFDVICELFLNRRTATWNLFVKWNTESLMTQDLGCLITSPLHEPTTLTGNECFFLMLFNCGRILAIMTLFIPPI